MDNLAGISVILVCAASLMFVACHVLDRQVASGRIEMTETRSMAVMRPRNVAILLLTYAAIAFSQDISLEWLASIAFLVCCSASLVRRCVAIAMRRCGHDGNAPVGGDGTGANCDGEEAPVVVAGRMTEMFTDILIYVSAADLVLLFGMALVENVIPYYVGLVVG